jgi:signal transduction histidine kinase
LIQNEARKRLPAGLLWPQASVAGGCHPVRRVLAYLTARLRRRTVSGSPRPEVVLEAEQIDARCDELERLRAEVAELRASRTRLVLAADADCRRIEHDLHEGAQQQLVALAVNLQLAGPLLDANPAAAKALLEEMERDIHQALDDAARLAERIYPPLLEAGGLAAALRSAAVSAGIRASVKVTAGSTFAPEIARTVYLCWLEALEHAGGEAPATVTVREEDGALTFEFVGSKTRLDRLRDRVEALGGRLTVESDAGRGIRVSGSLPLSS